MPVIEIDALLPEACDRSALLEGVARAAAAAFETDARHCWVVLRAIEPGGYLEGGRVRTAADATSVSPIVTIRAFAGRTPAVRGRVLSAVAAAVGEGLGLDPALPFVEYREIPPGCVMTGGRVRD